MKKPLLYFVFWMVVLTPICLFLGKWKLILILLLMLLFVSVLGFVFIKEFRKYLPFTFALTVSLCVGIWGYPYFV